MIRQAVVVAGAIQRRVAGLPVLVRTLRVLAKSGISQIFVIGPQARVDPMPGVTINFVADLSPVRGTFLFVESGRVFDVALAQAAAATPVEADAALACTDARGSRTGVYVIGEQRARASLDTFAERLVTTASPLEIGVGFSHRADSEEHARAAEDALFNGLRKRTDGPIARWLNRPISLAVTRAIVGTSVTPNQMTIVANIVGALGVWLVFRATWWSVAAGALLVQAQSILDGCDGEIARLKLQSSRIGEWLDNVLDDHVNIAYGVALGYASAQLLDQQLWLWLGIAAGAAFLLHNLAFYLELALVHRSGNPFNFRWWFEKPGVDVTAMLERPTLGARLAAVVRAFVRRDVFIFVFLLLAVVRLPQVAVAGYAAIAASQLTLMVLHQLLRGRATT